jgi:membrane associated rhomboid family serine protease
VQPAPPLSRIPAFPVVTVVAAMAIFVTIAVKTGKTEMQPFLMSSVAFDNQPWRLAASALPHLSAFHLIFNVVWLWILGTRLEETLGHVTTFVIIVVLAVGSAAAEFAFAAGGVGLSGVGYGLVGCLFVLARKDRRFRDAIDKRTLVLFAVWFVLCVILTVTDVLPVGNVAHGAGFVLGVLVGYLIAPGAKPARAAAGVALVALVASSLAAAALWRPQLNFSVNAAFDDTLRAWDALEAKQYAVAVRHLERALALDPNDAANWYNYGVALQYVAGSRGMTPLDAWERSLALDPTNIKTREVVLSERSRRGP